MAGTPPLGMPQKSANDLQSALQNMAPPQNPQTPLTRKTDSDIIFLDNVRIKESLKRALQNVTDPDMEHVLNALYDFMRNVTEAKVLPAVAKQGLLADLGAAGAPSMGAPGLPAATPQLIPPGQAQAPVGIMGAGPAAGNSPPVPPAV